MGIWGDGVFENDSALDYASNFRDARYIDLATCLSRVYEQGQYNKLAQSWLIFELEEVPAILHTIQLSVYRNKFLHDEDVEFIKKQERYYHDNLASLYPSVSLSIQQSFDGLLNLAKQNEPVEGFYRLVPEDDTTFKTRENKINASVGTYSYIDGLVDKLKSDIQSGLYDARPEFPIYHNIVMSVVLPAVYLLYELANHFSFRSLTIADLSETRINMWKDEYMSFFERWNEITDETKSDGLPTREKVIHETFDKLIATLEKQKRQNDE